MPRGDWIGQIRVVPARSSRWIIRAPQLQIAHSPSITASGALSSKSGTAGSARKE